ncbi:hypothetical protein LTR86_011149 [Recurvomyces mirabilis]|nr:hypothetical protein LTR86_011149 [Recurvomyces mirabilis]
MPTRGKNYVTELNYMTGVWSLGIAVESMTGFKEPLSLPIVPSIDLHSCTEGATFAAFCLPFFAMLGSCCDKDFAQWSHLQNHIRSSKIHQNCRRCRKGFLDEEALEQHVRDAAYHKSLVRAPPEAMASSTRSTVILPQTAASRPNAILLSYKGVSTALIKPVFRVACVENIIGRTHTPLDPQIVSAILEGALRLLPSDNTVEGQTARRAKMAAKAEQAKTAEETFLSRLRDAGYQFQDERQQKQRIQAAIDKGIPLSCRLTPDVLFDTPTMIFGHTCHWIEYKNTFGFKSSPYVHQKNKAQFQRYVAQMGEGTVVYKLGYESGLITLPSVQICREAEAFACIDLHGQDGSTF